jgi:hypothetical protein
LRDSGCVDGWHANGAVAGEVVLGHPHTFKSVPFREVDFPQPLFWASRWYVFGGGVRPSSGAAISALGRVRNGSKALHSASCCALGRAHPAKQMRAFSPGYNRGGLSALELPRSPTGCPNFCFLFGFGPYDRALFAAKPDPADVDRLN